MNYTIGLLIVISFCTNSFSQISAITEDGKKVILFDNYRWKYDDMQTESDWGGIIKIEIRPDGLVRIDLWAKKHHIDFFDGTIVIDADQAQKLEYYQNSFFEKSVGKIKQITFDDISVSFEYQQNTIFKKSLGKIKSMSFGNETLSFEYHENSFFDKSEGKIKRISKGHDNIDFEYYQNSLFPETEGKLKEINGNIPGVSIRYTE